jgi:hypothetical protein
MLRATSGAFLLLAAAVWSAAADTYPVAVLQGLDKVTARVTTLQAPVGETVRFATLQIKAAVCEKRPPEETPESAAFLEIVEQRPGQAPVNVFRGWMFASSPGLSPMQHPVYDLWMVDCVSSLPSAKPRASPGGSP